jgi:DNA-binding response OmpR family regulator
MGDILLVEASDAEAQAIEYALRRAGVKNRIARFARWEQASNAGASPAPAVLLLDLKLPDVSGLDVLAELQSRKTFSKTLRIVLSDLHDTESIKRAYTLGAHSFLGKPIHPQELMELIQTFPEYWVLE